MHYLCLLFLVFLASCKSLDSVQCTIDSVHHNSVSQLSTLNSQLSTIADTIHVVEYRDRLVEHPPERYIPPFYKRCTIVLWILIVGIVLYAIRRIRFPTSNL